MNNFILPLLMAGQQASGEPASPVDMFKSFIPLIAIIAIFYFLIIRPQSKKRKEAEKMIAAIKKGDKIITAGGIYGTVQSVKEATIIVKVDDNVKLEFARGSISTVVNQSKEIGKEEASEIEKSQE
jgi:preprotein translocase subunit YajC